MEAVAEVTVPQRVALVEVVAEALAVLAPLPLAAMAQRIRAPVAAVLVTHLMATAAQALS